MKCLGRAMLFLLCATWLPILEPALADPPVGIPTANTDIPALVPSPLAQKIALRHAQYTWGQVALGPSFVCADDDGDIVAYAFTFAIRKSSFPTTEELSSYLRYGRDVAERGFEALSEADKQSLQKTIASKALLPQPSAAPAGLPPRKKALVAESPSAMNEYAREYGKQKMIGAGDFGTVVVSARHDRFPIPYYSGHLPTYMYNGDVAEEKAAKALSVDKVSLDRIYFIEGEECSSSSPRPTDVLMHSGNLQILPFEKVLKRRGKKVIPVSEARMRIIAEWDRVQKGLSE